MNLDAVLLALIAAATGITRDVDPDLTLIAADRAAEVSTDATFSHDGQRTTSEVLVWIPAGSPDPAAAAIERWMASSEHHAILTNDQLLLIGCGHAVGQDDRDVFACVLEPGAAGLAPMPTATPETPDELPNVSVLGAIHWPSFLYGLGLGFAIAAIALGLAALHAVRNALRR